MKNREQVMMERNDRGYYRCKIWDAKLYDEIMGVYSCFINPDITTQLNHVWSTQKNESMNTSLSSYAPNTKHHLGLNLWRPGLLLPQAIKLLVMLDSGQNHSLVVILILIRTYCLFYQHRPNKKKEQNNSQKTLYGKRKRNTNKYSKMNKDHRHYMER